MQVGTKRKNLTPSSEASDRVDLRGSNPALSPVFILYLMAISYLKNNMNNFLIQSTCTHIDITKC